MVQQQHQLYCAYCGRGFTRKEHLERHLPQHTQVKPHRCSACQLSFARRDLLQRHHQTYHEPRDPMEPLPGGVPQVAGKTPIACSNCAQAKTGCDKRVPCARCKDKNLPCAARFARRSSKAAKAAQSRAALTAKQESQQGPEAVAVPRPPTTALADVSHSPAATGPEKARLCSGTPTMNPAFMDIDNRYSSAEVAPLDPLLQQHDNAMSEDSPNVSDMGSGAISPVNMQGGSAEDLIQFGTDFLQHGGHYQDISMWPDLPMDFDMSSGTMRQDLVVPTVPGARATGSSSASPKMNSSQDSASTHTRHTSISSNIHSPSAAMNDGYNDSEALEAAEAGWPLARCNPPIFSSHCPRTAIVHLERLEQRSKQEGTWDALDLSLQSREVKDADQASVVPMTARSRERMLAITQTFLHKALEIHRGGMNRQRRDSHAVPGLMTFLVLPPSNIVEHFLRNHVRSLSLFYSLVSTGSVDPNDLLSGCPASILLVLLMIAQGASTVPSEEAQALSAGLTETCRISLFDMIEKDVEMSADPTSLQCALLFTLLGAWSGDKWLMDIAMGQRGMYIAMLKHAGMFEAQRSVVSEFHESPKTPELKWHEWVSQETKNRLAYNWVMVDQELSLFHDTAPMLSVSELLSPLPGPELLWMSANTEQWSAAVQQTYGRTAGVNPQFLKSRTPSLYDLFQEFLHDNLGTSHIQITPQHLRLLLHPLQSLLCHLRQVLSCFSDVMSISTRAANAGTVTKASTTTRMREVQVLLQKWYELSIANLKRDPECCTTKTNLVLYHLISLNAVTSFPEVERLARKDAFDGSHWEFLLRRGRCIFHREEAVFHCGQVFRLLRALPANKRPSWWAAALYRATLILWVDSSSIIAQKSSETIGDLSGSFPNTGNESSATDICNPVVIDRVTSEDQSVFPYIWHGNGTPVLTGIDGSMISLEKPGNILLYAIQAIEERPASRLSDGIRRKLLALDSNWQENGFGTQHPQANPAALQMGHPPMLMPMTYTMAHRVAVDHHHPEETVH